MSFVGSQSQMDFILFIPVPSQPNSNWTTHFIQHKMHCKFTLLHHRSAAPIQQKTAGKQVNKKCTEEAKAIQNTLCTPVRLPRDQFYIFLHSPFLFFWLGFFISLLTFVRVEKDCECTKKNGFDWTKGKKPFLWILHALGCKAVVQYFGS